jgi:hypothetical protein
MNQDSQQVQGEEINELDDNVAASANQTSTEQEQLNNSELNP